MNRDEEADLVRQAADGLTDIYGPDWPSWVRLSRLSMLSMRNCVLAQVETRSGLTIPHDKLPFFSGVGRLYRAHVDTRAFVVRREESTRRRRAAWKREIRKRRKEARS